MQFQAVLKRVFSKGCICFEVPAEPELQSVLRELLLTCHLKNGDYVSVTLKRPYAPRSTGPKSQNHHLNGHIMQICQATGNDYEVIKYCVKMIAVEQLGYPSSEVAGHVLPKPERDCDSYECGLLIEAAHFLAAQLSIVLQEVEE